MGTVKYIVNTIGMIAVVVIVVGQLGQLITSAQTEVRSAQPVEVQAPPPPRYVRASWALRHDLLDIAQRNWTHLPTVVGERATLVKVHVHSSSLVQNWEVDWTPEEIDTFGSDMVEIACTQSIKMRGMLERGASFEWVLFDRTGTELLVRQVVAIGDCGGGAPGTGRP